MERRENGENIRDNRVNGLNYYKLWMVSGTGITHTKWPSSKGIGCKREDHTNGMVWE